MGKHAGSDGVDTGTLGRPPGLRSGVSKLCRFISQIVSETLLVLLFASLTVARIYF